MRRQNAYVLSAAEWTELKNAKGYVTAQRMGTWAQARAGLKWLRFGGKLIFGI